MYFLRCTARDLSSCHKKVDDPGVKCVPTLQMKSCPPFSWGVESGVVKVFQKEHHATIDST